MTTLGAGPLPQGRLQHPGKREDPRKERKQESDNAHSVCKGFLIHLKIERQG